MCLNSSHPILKLETIVPKNVELCTDMRERKRYDDEWSNPLDRKPFPIGRNSIDAKDSAAAANTSMSVAGDGRTPPLPLHSARRWSGSSRQMDFLVETPQQWNVKMCPFFHVPRQCCPSAEMFDQPLSTRLVEGLCMQTGGQIILRCLIGGGRGRR